jgi:hypothetical protein
MQSGQPDNIQWATSVHHQCIKRATAERTIGHALKYFNLDDIFFKRINAIGELTSQLKCGRFRAMLLHYIIVSSSEHRL